MAEGAPNPEAPTIAIANASGDIVGERNIGEVPVPPKQVFPKSYSPVFVVPSNYPDPPPREAQVTQPSQGDVVGNEPVPPESALPPAALPDQLPPTPPPPSVPRTPEVPPEQPPYDSIEFDASPERGSQIAAKIMYWEAIRMTGKDSHGVEKSMNWDALNEAYADEVVHIEALRMHSNKAKLEDPVDEEPEEVLDPILLVNLDNLRHADGTPFKPAEEWFRRYQDKHNLIPADNMPQFIAEANAYIEEAKRIGLFRELDDVLTTVYNGQVMSAIKGGKTVKDAMPAIDNTINLSLASLSTIMLDRGWADLGMQNLIGVAEIYASLAKERFASAIMNHDTEGVNQRPYDVITNEFHLVNTGEESVEEKFWHIDYQYPKVDAKTDTEFQIAAETYISRLEEMKSYSPQEMIQETQAFVRAIRNSDGYSAVNRKHPGLIDSIIFQMEGRLGFHGAEHTNNLYHGDQYKDYLNWLNKEGEGPARWLAGVKMLDGKVLATLWELDNDPTWEAMFALYGSRGQLAAHSETQRTRKDNIGLYAEIKEHLVDRMLGVTIKNKRNVDKLTQFKPGREFAGAFHGLYVYGEVPEGREAGDGNIQAYKKYLAENPNRERRLTKSQRLGKIQLELEEIRERIGEKKVILKDNGEPYDLMNDKPYELLENKSDRRFYQDALADAKKAVDVALQIYTTTGELAKRAGDVFIVDKPGGYQEFVPRHYAEKVVQFAETWTKIKYADDALIWKTEEFQAKIKGSKDNKGKVVQEKILDFRAKYRTAMVEIARTRAIRGIKTNGFDVKLFDADYSADYLERAAPYLDKLNKDNNLALMDALDLQIPNSNKSMMLKRPKEDPSQADGLARDPDGNVIAEDDVPVNFYLATHHVYGRWTGHTYWSYQEEHRHLLLSPKTEADARAVRDGTLRPEDADDIAIQRLLIDPTLLRTRRFLVEHMEERERKLIMMGVEDSYQGHFRIGRELYRVFWPKLGTPSTDMKVYYNLQDVNGYTKILDSMRGQIAEDSARFSRRGPRLLPDLHNPVVALSEYLGQGTSGALGIFNMMSSPVYREFGTMALDKFSAMMDFGGKVKGALIENADNDGNYIEGLLLKLLNESDELQGFDKNKLPREDSHIWADEAHQQEFCSLLRKTFGRLERYLKILVIMESKTRNASGALWAENMDVLDDTYELSRELQNRMEALPKLLGVTGDQKDMTRDDLAQFIKEAEAIDRATEASFNKHYRSGTDEPDQPKVDGLDEGKPSGYTGTGRHSARIFFDTFIDLLIDNEKRGGQVAYGNEKSHYSHIDDKLIFRDPTQRKDDDKEFTMGVSTSSDRIRDWLFNKLVPT